MDIYVEHYKAPMKELKEQLNKWTDLTYSLIRMFNSVKMSVLPILTYRFNTSPIKILSGFFGTYQ